MSVLRVDLASPERPERSCEATSVSASGMEGDFMVLAGHAPLAALLRGGVVEIRGKSGEPGERWRYYVEGGVLEVSGGEEVRILSERVWDLSLLEGGEVEAEARAAREDEADAKEDVARREARARAERWEGIAAALEEGVGASGGDG